MSVPLRLLADEDFDNDILRGALRRLPDLDVVRAQQAAPIGRVIGDVLLLAQCSLEGEWQGQIRYLPL